MKPCVCLLSSFKFVLFSLPPFADTSPHILQGSSTSIDAIVSDKDLETIARKHITDWESLCPYLGLNRTEKKHICNSYRTYKAKCQECLELWKEKKGSGATYNELITVAKDVNNQQLADAITAIVQEK